jgi:tungstate transport system substrate-binding protein
MVVLGCRRVKLQSRRMLHRDRAEAAEIRGVSTVRHVWSRFRLLSGWVERVRLLGVALVFASAMGCTPAPTYLDIATTTSVQNSGLLDTLLPHFTEATVRVLPAGSGRALKMLSDSTVELVISHAPETEARYLAQHPRWVYRKIAFNRFLVIGPRNDPAHVREATSAIDAFRRIAAAPVTFVSRGDESGTHERERSLWKTAGVIPPPSRLIVSGQSMAVALRQTNERQGYTLSDDATFWQLQSQLDLAAVFNDDPLLLNTYAVIHPPGNRLAALFAEWLARGAGRDRVARYSVHGQVAFSVWPPGCPADTPAALPCGSK